MVHSGPLGWVLLESLREMLVLAMGPGLTGPHGMLGTVERVVTVT